MPKLVILSTVVVALVLAAPAAGYTLGPHPVPCTPAPCQQVGTVARAANGALLMSESTIVHLAISPHIVSVGGIVTMSVSYSGTGHCNPSQSECGPQGVDSSELEPVNCAKPNPSNTSYQPPLTTTTWCYYVITGPGVAVNQPSYQIFDAPAGNCQVSDCVSADYLLVEPACQGRCPLSVSVKVFGATTAGQGYDSSQTPAQAAFLTAGGNFGQGKCISGCRNVQVTVTDKKTGQAVSGALLSASVTSFPPGAIAPYSAGEESGDGHLCLANSPTRCGSGRFITDVTTDASGDADYLYWAPGAISAHTVKITVKASIACAACIGGKRTGEATIPVKVTPNVLYSSSATLSGDQTRMIAAWHKDGGLFDSAQVSNQVFSDLLENALSLVTGEMEAKIGAGVVAKVASIATQEGQDQAFASLFSSWFNLVPIGLGSTQDDGLDAAYVDAIAGKDGLVERYGAALEKHNGTVTKQLVKLTLTEVSYCQSGQLCGPGTPASGIHQLLAFRFQGGVPPAIGRLTGEGYPTFDDTIVMPYDAFDFDVAQFAGKAPTG